MYIMYVIYTHLYLHINMLYIYIHKFIHIYKFDSSQERDSVGGTVTKFRN